MPAGNHLGNLGGGHYGHYYSCEMVLNLDQWFRIKCCLKMFLIYSSGDHLCNFGRGHYEKHFCEIILNLDQWFRRCHLKIFHIYSSGSYFIRWRETICVILVEGIMGNMHVKLF